MDKRKLNEVYGLSRDVPLTYIARKPVDDRFVEDITRDKHVVVHGSSKQGKTCLRKQHLNEGDFVAVQCTRDLTKAKLYEMILKQAGVCLLASRTQTAVSSSEVNTAGEMSGGTPWLVRAKVMLGLKKGTSNQTQETHQEFEIDLNDPNDIVRVLKAADFKKYIVIEDFHYLSDDIQQAFAFDLKVFHESSKLVFIVIGVWLEANRLILFNGDLAGRICTIDADVWTDAELREVVTAGYPLLNVQFPQEVEDAIIEGCQRNVGLLQEVCHRLCEGNNVHATLEDHRAIGSVQEVRTHYERVANEQAARYQNFLAMFSEGLSVTSLQMYRWIAWVVVNAKANELRAGLPTNVVHQRIVAEHPARTLQQNNVAQALQRVSTVQFKHKLQPLIFDFSDNRLRVVDANFLVYIETQPKGVLLDIIGMEDGSQYRTAYPA